MPDGEETERHAEQLADDVAKARAWSRDLLAQVVRAARTCAETEEMVAGTLDHLAETQPHRAAGLRARSAFAWAAQERQFAEDHEAAAEQQEEGG